MPDWLSTVLPSAATTLLILAAVWAFGRDRIAKAIDARVQHRYNAELEKLRNDLTKGAKEIETLRSIALTSRSQRVGLVDKRRLEAIDELWSAIAKLQPWKNGLALVGIIKLKAFADATEKDEKARTLFKAIMGRKGDAIEPYPHGLAHGARPYLSPLSLALFRTYNLVLAFHDIRVTAIALGAGTNAFPEGDALIPSLVASLPDWKERIENGGEMEFAAAVDELESRILGELQRLIDGTDDDAMAVMRANQINQLVSAAAKGLEPKGAQVFAPTVTQTDPPAGQKPA